MENQDTLHAKVMEKLGCLTEAVNGVKETVGEIKEQTTLTNGRVSKLEETKSKLVGGFVVINLIIIPILIFFFIKWIDTKITVAVGV